MSRFAYADPPYPGQARSRYRDGVEVNHPLLIAHLREFDGWALSTSAAALLEIWRLCPEARCASWVKTWASNGWARVRYCWEPVLFVTPKRGIKPGERSEVWDALVSSPAMKWSEMPGKGGGAKPPPFIAWVLDLLGATEADEVVDVFPGSGGFSRRQTELELSETAS